LTQWVLGGFRVRREEGKEKSRKYYINRESPHQKEKKKKGETAQAAKKLLTSIKEKGPLGKKSPSPEKKKASQ